ncbi:MAG: glycosyltransferase [Proteobacteria bacterium]|nr:glycosyltransferase [Pseudomonadota bacterium]
MAKILFVHHFFPGQFGFIATALVEAGNEVVALGGRTASELPGVSLVRWQNKRGTTPNILPTAVRAEADMIRAAAALEAARGLLERGFSPDVIIAHPGWGETLYLRELWPNARLILHAEFFYSATGGELGFDPEFGTVTLVDRCRAVSKSATLALAYSQADRLVAPTPFQASRLPECFRSRTTVIHEGVDLQEMRPTPGARVTVGEKTFDRNRPLVTFASRVLEPLRGCHTFFRALPRILDDIPDAEIVIAGAETGAGYGLSPPENETWKSHFWKEIEGRVDPARIHFVGWLPNETLNALMSIARAHVYLTYPFVLSWSLLEAMACEALVIGSDTPPLHDVIVNGENGLLVDFLRQDLLAEAIVEACRHPERFQGMRAAARQSMLAHYDRRNVCLPQWLDLVRST